jgi:hypothetical protein
MSGRGTCDQYRRTKGEIINNPEAFDNGFAEGSIRAPEGSEMHFHRPTVLIVFNQLHVPGSLSRR